MPQKFWTEADILFLRNNYGKRKANFLTKALNCSYSQLWYKANSLGLKSDLRINLYDNKRKKSISSIESRGFKVLGTYSNANTSIDIQCFCGKTFKSQPGHIISGHTSSCGCIKGLKNRKGTDLVSKTYFSIVKKGALARGYAFDITIEYISDLLITQNFKCALSGMEIGAGYKSYMTASLDRIDNSKGYLIGNVQWVHKDVNWMKQDFEQTYFIDFCKQIAKFNS